MNINSLKIQNFRSYKELSLNFGKNTIIVGPNAQGKTNLLEAIYLTSIGKSFRAKEADMVKWDEDFFRIEADVKNDREQKIEYIFEKNVGKGRKTVKINGAKKPASALLAGFRCVFFAPDEIDMFFNFPSHRRRYFNIMISKISRDYARELVRYKRVLEQRNALLKAISEGRGKESDLEIWDGKIADHGSKIILERNAVVAKINEKISDSYNNIAKEKSKLVLNYEPSIKSFHPFKNGKKIKPDEIWAKYIEDLLASRRQDLALRVTSVGPHRDNFSFFLDERAVMTFASRGELRSVIVSLKFSEASILKKDGKEAPVLLLDDVFSELDEERREYLVKAFSSQQTIVTTTDLDHIAKDMRKNADIYVIKNSKVKKI